MELKTANETLIGLGIEVDSVIDQYKRDREFGQLGKSQPFLTIEAEMLDDLLEDHKTMRAEIIRLNKVIADWEYKEWLREEFRGAIFRDEGEHGEI